MSVKEQEKKKSLIKRENNKRTGNQKTRKKTLDLNLIKVDW